MQNIQEHGGSKILGGEGKCSENPNQDPDMRLTGNRESVTWHRLEGGFIWKTNPGRRMWLQEKSRVSKKLP